MDNLVVHNELVPAVVDNQSTDAAAALVVGIADALEQAALVEDRQTLLDIAGLRHGDDAAILTHVNDTVRQEHGPTHGLHHHGRRRVGDNARILPELASEEVHTQVPVLTGLARDRDPNDLSRVALQDQDITQTNKVSRDGDGVGRVGATRADDTDLLPDTGGARRTLDHLVPHTIMVVMREGVQKAVGRTLNTAAEGVVVAVVVVVTHLASRSFFAGDFPPNSDFFLRLTRLFVGVDAVAVAHRVGARLVGLLGLVDGGLVVGLNATAILAFSDVDLRLEWIGVVDLAALLVGDSRLAFFVAIGKLAIRMRRELSRSIYQ